MRLIATKNRRYGSRRLSVGDEFEAKGRMAKVLKAVGLAVDAPTTPTPAPPAPPPVKAIDPLEVLRGEYTRLTGKQPRQSWDADDLRQKIEDKKQPVKKPRTNKYRTRQMKAED